MCDDDNDSWKSQLPGRLCACQSDEKKEVKK